MARPQLTLLVLTRTGSQRTDWSHGACVGQWSLPLDDSGDPFPIENTLEIGPPPARQVAVLTETAWTQTVSLPANAVRGLDTAGLSQALRFETEPLSGIPALESALAFVPQTGPNGARWYWVAQVRTTEFDRAQQAVQKAGGRLVGVAHPGGVPLPLTLPEDAAWQRVELWSEVVVCQHAPAQQAPMVFVVNADGAQNRWVGPVDEWRAKLNLPTRREMRLTTGELVTFDANDQEETAVAGEPAQLAWLRAWVRVLVAPAGRVPLVQPPKPARVPLLLRSLTVGIAALALLACITHRTLTLSAATLTTDEFNALQERYTQQQNVQAEQKKMTAEASELRKQIAPLANKLELCQAGLSAHRQRKAQLLRLLAEHCPDDLTIRAIDIEATEPCVKGWCLTPQAAHRLAARLEPAARPLTWQVQPPKLIAQRQLANGGPWSFEIRLREVVPAGLGPARPAPTGE